MGEKDENLEIGAAGVKVKAPVGLAVRTLFPFKVARGETIAALSASACEKIARGEPLSSGERAVHAKVMAPIFKEAARIARIEARAEQIFTMAPKQLLAPTKNEPESAEPSEAWTAHWRAAAKIASDDYVEEMWAQILAGECKTPGRFSFKTLSVLRDIGIQTAEAFVKLLTYRLHSFPPAGTPGTAPNWERFQRQYIKRDFTYVSLLDLQDAGLVSFRDSSFGNEDGTPMTLRVQGAVVRVAGHTWTGRIAVHPFTAAGDELASVATAYPSNEAMEDLRGWLTNQVTKVEIAILRGGETDVEALEFRDWTPGAVLFEDGPARWAPSAPADGAAL